MPNKARVDISPDNAYYILTGLPGNFLGNGRARLYLEDVLHGISGDNGDINIPFIPETKEKTFKLIKDFLVKFGFEEELSASTQGLLNDFISEENRFDIFSRQAFTIRNNDLSVKQKKEFGDFIDVLKDKLPSRILYPRQLLAAYHLAFSQNACNFSVPGSGKTTIVLAAYTYLLHQASSSPKKIDKLLIIGPLSSFGPWEDEFQSCFGRKANAQRLHGGIPREKVRDLMYSSNPPELILTTYHSAARIKEELIYFFTHHKTMVVLDEAHKIKNTEGGLLADSSLELSKYCAARVILTGTPAPNGYEDLHNLFKFIWPTKSVIKFMPGHLKAMSSSPRDYRIPEVIKNISPYFMRIKKSDLGLPSPTENPPILVKMGDIQRQIYSYVEKKIMRSLLPMGSFSDIVARARMIRMMQAATNPALLQKPLADYIEAEDIIGGHITIEDTLNTDPQIFKLIMDYPRLETPSKFIEAARLAKEITDRGGKVVIWSIFIQNIMSLQSYLRLIGIQAKVLYGGTPVENEYDDPLVETREQIIKEFNSTSSSFNVLIANPFAVSESISLHKACHNAVYLERSFNAAHFVQSKDRIHRYGLPKDAVINYYYILSDTNIDKTIHERLKMKEKRMLDVMEKEEIPLFQALDDSESDIKALVDNYTCGNP